MILIDQLTPVVVSACLAIVVGAALFTGLRSFEQSVDDMPSAIDAPAALIGKASK